MTGLHFRRYELKPDAMPDFLAWWRQIRPIRERHSFQLLFAIYLPEPNEFVSAWSYNGDLNQLQDRYYHDPDRQQLAKDAHAWAEADARRRGEDPAEVTAEHPGFTHATHITEGLLAEPGQLRLQI